MTEDGGEETVNIYQATKQTHPEGQYSSLPPPPESELSTWFIHVSVPAYACVASLPIETKRTAVCSEADSRNHNGDGEGGWVGTTMLLIKQRHDGST
jgi:hypothetical protein